MKKCPKPLGYGIRRTPVVLGLSAALCMPAAFSYANVDNGMDRESVLSVMQGKTIKGQILDETGESMIGVSVLVKGTTIGEPLLILMVIIHLKCLVERIYWRFPI